MDDKNGNASLAATAYAEIPAQPTTNPNAPAPGAASGVSPAAGAAPSQPNVISGPAPSTQGGNAQVGGGPVGKVIKGRYKIKRLLGEGGMGGVYEGEHLEIGKRVAIKLVHSLHARDPQIAARIKQEARATGSLESENIVQVFDAGEDEELGLFLVMELLKGEDLATLLARRRKLSQQAAATLILQAAQGLARAHAAGIVHRDLKPANMFVVTRDDGSSLVKLVDFGIAKLVRDANQAQDAKTGGLTRMGTVIGTPQYMSPEQAQGLPSVDHRTDIYSLGAVLFECVCGASPFAEMPTYEQTILQIMTRQAPRISQVVPDVSPELDQLCADMMAHDASQRPQDMAQVRERILHAFPELEGGRMPMRSLTNEAALDATISAEHSGQVRALIDKLNLPQSGVGMIPRPTGTGPGVAGRPPSGAGARGVTGQGVAVSQHDHEEDPIDDVAGVPRKKKGGAGMIVVVGIVAAAIGVGGALFMKSRASADTAQGYGLVQSTAVATQPAAAPPPAAPAPTVAAAPPVVDTPAVDPHAGKGGKNKAAKGASASASSPAAPAAAPAAPAAPAPAPAAKAPTPAAKPDKGSDNSDRPVGGTKASDEF
jgi:serine/threonine-protein kinase